MSIEVNPQSVQRLLKATESLERARVQLETLGEAFSSLSDKVKGLTEQINLLKTDRLDAQSELNKISNCKDLVQRTVTQLQSEQKRILDRLNGIKRAEDDGVNYYDDRDYDDVDYDGYQ